MPHDPTTLRQDVIEGETGQPDQVVLTKYIAPAAIDESVAEDPYKEYDLWVAKRAMDLLQKTYPGHFWSTRHDTALNPRTGNHDKVLLIAIPILMGVNNYMAINRQTTELTPERVVMAGGELLERYGLPRGRLEVASFLDAREKHSALVVPSRKVPN